ncbi:UDP-N-acetyl glucosamine 2-epimerase, partial [Streptomyces sp. SID7499]|nr:UDP-N-acetyl glucosamine 2-epimerase [Streptomyces sp. SID7499]
EAVHRHRPSAEVRAKVLAEHGISRDGYALATVHRPENTDDPTVLADLLAELAGLARDLPVVLPLHPRTRIRAE